MKGPTSFKIIGYLSISPKRTGVLYPVFSTEGVNVSFVQEVGKDGEITDFIPFYEHERFFFEPANELKAFHIGTASAYAFFDGSGKLVEIDFDAIGRRVRVSNDIISDEDMPLLTKLALARIGRGGDPEKLLAAFLAARLSKPRSIKVAKAASIKTAAERDQWWSAISQTDEPELPSSPDDVGALELESAFEWLYENPVSDRWSRSLRNLLNRIIYDQRIFDLIIKLVTSVDLPLEDLSARDKSIIGRGMELYSALDSSEADFVDAIYDHIVSGEIFKVVDVVPLEIVVNFIEDIESSGVLDTVAADIYLEELRSDHIKGPVAITLIERIMSSQSLKQQFGSKSYYEGQTRLDVLKDIVAQSGRLGLVLDPRVRNSIKRTSVV